MLLSLAQLAVAQSAAQRGAPAESSGSETRRSVFSLGPSPEGRPLRGVVWSAPGRLTQAEDDLRRMRAMGVEAVRTGLIAREALLTHADTLGLRLFQELPLDNLPAAALRDSLPGARRLLERALRRAQQHPSARHFGLVRGSDTSDPAACAVVEALAEHVRRRGPAGSQVYYQTLFAAADACAAAVDFVLVDARALDDPLEPARRWARHQSVPVGLGAVGTWVAEDAAAGLRVPHSPEAQARYLERHLPALLGRSNPRLDDSTPDVSAALPLTAVFVHRWRDAGAAGSPVAFDDVYGRRYGLLTGDGDARPALRVVRGLYTGAQQVFAFPQGERAPPALPWALLIGWGIVGALGVFYVSIAPFRRMAARYFSSPGFYREAVREGRGAVAGAGAVLLVALAASAGQIAVAALGAAQGTAPLAFLLSQLDAGAQLIEGLARPWTLMALAAALYAGALLLWAVLLAAASRRAFRLQSAQALLLVVWPRWPLLALAIAALVAPTLLPPWGQRVALGAVAGGLCVSVWATGRTLYDFAALARPPGALVAALACASPLVVGAVVGLFAGLQYQPEVAFLWHLLWRT